MNRTKRTAANAIFQVLSIFIQSFLVLIVTREIIANIGSDYNGISSTATQLLTFLTIIEGGFTLASLVKIYKPYGENDYNILNKYLSLSNKKFHFIAVLYLIVGSVISFGYAPFVKTDVSYLVTVTIILLSVFSSAFSVYYVSAYRLIYQVSQSEYIIYMIQIITNVFMYVTEIIVVRVTKNIIAARICVTVFQIINGLIIGIVAKRMFKYINLKHDTDGVVITGTKDVFVSKICGFVFSSSSVLFISTFVGTAYTSVYAVYNSVLAVIANVINSFLIAPRNALGQMISEEDNRLKSVFNEYEFISSLSMTILFSVTLALITPFVNLYTRGVADINYIDTILAVLLILNSVFQMIHIPSGTCLEVSGRFKVIKRIQGAAAIIIIFLSIVGAYTYGIYGILIAKLITSIFLCVAEILYTRKKILMCSVCEFFKVNLPSLITGSLLAVFEFNYFLTIDISIIQFVIYGFVLVIINSAALILVNIVLNRMLLINSVKRIKNLIRR